MTPKYSELLQDLRIWAINHNPFTLIIWRRDEENGLFRRAFWFCVRNFYEKRKLKSIAQRKKYIRKQFSQWNCVKSLMGWTYVLRKFLFHRKNSRRISSCRVKTRPESGEKLTFSVCCQQRALSRRIGSYSVKRLSVLTFYHMLIFTVCMEKFASSRKWKTFSTL